MPTASTRGHRPSLWRIPGDFGPRRWRSHAGGRGLHHEFLAAVDEMNRAHPGLENRIHRLDRSFDRLHYLLSEPRRLGKFDGTDLGTRAILGSTRLADHLRATAGHPIRLTRPAEVREISHWLAGLNGEVLRLAYDPERMEQQSVYKFWADQADQETWNSIVRAFEGFRSFYETIAAHEEGLLTIVT